MASSQLFTLRSVMMALAAIQLVTAASGTLVALYFAETGASQATAAIAPAAYNLGFLLGCFFAAGPISNIGYIRSFSAAAALSAASALLFSLTEFEPALMLVRLLTGLATAGMFAIGDSWINETVKPEARGRVLGIYAVLMGAMAVVSQLVVVFMPDDLDKSFVLVSLLYCFAIVVIAGTRVDPPEIKSSAKVRIRGLFKESPTAMIGAFVVGAVQTSLISIAPFRFSILGIGSVEIALMVAALYVGRILVQYPLGTLSDRMDRRIVIFGASLVATAILLLNGIFGSGDGAIFKAFISEHSLAVALIYPVLLGASLLTLYSLLVAHGLDRTSPVFVSASAITILLANTAGCIVGPLAIGVLSEIFGDVALSWASFATMGGFTIFVAFRIKTVAPAAKAEKATRVVVTTNSVELAPERKRKETDLQI